MTPKRASSAVIGPVFIRLLLLSSLFMLGLRASPGHGQWIEPERQGWAAFSMFYLDTVEQFGPSGEVQEFVLNGHSKTASSFLTVALGVAPGVDIWIQPSYHRLWYNNLDGTHISWGFGDTRVYARTAPLRWLGSDFPFAIRAGVKVPSNLESGTNLIPLGDGQRDWEVVAEVGHSFWPRPLYASAWAGYRWREEGEFGEAEASFSRDFGNESFFNLTFGGGGERLGFKAQLEAWYGGTPLFDDQVGVGQEREMLRFSPSLLFTVGPGQVELGSRMPFAGQNLATGAEWVLGYFTRLSL